MSCWETSTFLPNPNNMKVSLLKDACQKLNWKFSVDNTVLTVWDAKQNSELYGEYALRVEGNNVTYNDYYMKNGMDKLNELKSTYMLLYLPYLVEKIQTTFREVGYSVRVNERFTKDATKYASFYVVASSKLKEEKGVEGKIKFTVLTDGTVETDSNYIPSDIHEFADQAMEKLEETLTMDREIKPKPRHLIPKEQRNKAHCKAKSKKIIQIKK